MNTVLVHTQYEENYGAHDWDQKGECPQHWKKKGAHVFKIELNIDVLMYSDAEAVFSAMLAEQTNDYERFTYIGHDVQFQSPTALGNQADYIKTFDALNAELV